jgi:hypothetical protein
VPGLVASRITDAELVGFSLQTCLAVANQCRLTARERDIYFLSLCDRVPKEIATALGLETGYVRVRQATIVRKLRTCDGMHGVRRVTADAARRLAELGREARGGGEAE